MNTIVMMENYLSIPLKLSFNSNGEALERLTVEESVRQFIDLLINTHQGECGFNPDFGYEIWNSEFEPILNIPQWQPRFMEQIKILLEKYEKRITSIQVREPEIKSLNKKRKSDRDYRITITLDYVILQTGEACNNVKISFDY
jgi:phage baseplate assembly protein W